jgi:hypothetical protein
VEKAATLGDLTFGAKVNIFGHTADCWAVVTHGDPAARGSAFVARSDINVSR